MSQPGRFIDLGIPWLAQYAGETTIKGLPSEALPAELLARLEGYLGHTELAVLQVILDATNTPAGTDPLAIIADQICRYEAEFCGRLLRDDQDFIRFQTEPVSLCWGLIALPPLSDWFQADSDLPHLDAMIERGARMIRLAGATTTAAGLMLGLDGRLTSLAAAAIERLQLLAGARSGRLILDLSGLPGPGVDTVLAWLQNVPEHERRLLPFCSLADRWCEPEWEARWEIIGELRGLLAVAIGTRDTSPPDALEVVLRRLCLSPTAAAHVGLLSGLLGHGPRPLDFANVERIRAWLVSQFGDQQAADLAGGNASRFLQRLSAPS